MENLKKETQTIKSIGRYIESNVKFFLCILPNIGVLYIKNKHNVPLKVYFYDRLK